MRFEYGSAYDDDAANEGRPAEEVAAERRRDMVHTHSTGHGTRSAADSTRLAYLRCSPDTECRQVLLMLGKRSWGSIDYDVCRACQRVHIKHAGVLAVMQGEGHEARMLRFARTKAPGSYRWTLGPGVDKYPFWTNVHGELDYTVERSCDHLRKKLPGTLEDLWGRLQWWRLTGQIWLPPTRADRKKRRKFLDALE